MVDEATDTRTAGQRSHDGFVWGMRTALESGNLGQHRGIPVTVIARTTVQDLERALSGFSRLKQTTARSILAFA